MRVILIFIIFITALYSGFSQNKKIDSLRKELTVHAKNDTSHVDLLNALATTYIHHSGDSTLKYGRKAIKLSRELNYSLGLANAYKSVGIVYIPKSRYDTAFAYFDSSFYYLDKSDNPMIRSEIYNGIGMANEESGNYGEAISSYLESLRIKTEIDDQAGVGKLHNNLGKAFYSLGSLDSATSHLTKALSNKGYMAEFDGGSSSLLNLGSVRFDMGEYMEAKDLFKRALFLKKKAQQPVPIATLNAWLGYVALKEGVVDSALYYYQLSLDQFKEINHIKGVAALTARVAQGYMAQSNYDSALVYLEKGIEDKASIGDKQDVPAFMVSIAQCYEKLGYPQKALEAAKDAAQLAAEINSKSESLLAFEYLFELYEKRNNIGDAYKALKSLLAYKDSVLNDQKVAEIKRLETIYGVGQLQQDKLQLEVEKETQNKIYTADLRRQNVITYSILGGLLSVMLLAISYYRSYRRKQRANDILEQKNELITKQKEDLSAQAEELQAINEKLEELSNFKEGLTHMIAHDMKNPLHVIISLTDGKLDKEKLRIIGQSGKEMLNLVTNMLDIQRFEEAKMELKEVHVPLIKLINEARLQTELLLVAKNIELKLELEKEAALYVDYQAIDRVIVNLLTNAVKYSPADGEITIRGEKRKQGFVDLSIQDHGDGIPEDEVSLIFEKFWQSNARKSGKAASSGLGLTFCKLAVEAHGGTIEVSSQLGKGTTITLSLPEGNHVGGELATKETISNQSKFDGLDMIELRQLHPQLSNLKVHQISQINSILNEVEAEGELSKWKLQIKTAVFDSDQSKFDELIDLIK